MVFFVFVILLLLPCGIFGITEDKQHVITQLSEVEAQLKLLETGLQKTAEIVSKLKSELSGTTRSGQELAEDLTPLRSCVRPLEAWRTVSNDGLKLTMKYLELADDVIVAWTDTMTELPESRVELPGKVLESNVILPINLTSDSIFMTAVCEDKRHFISYQFWMDREKSAQQNLTGEVMPVVELNTTGDIVYNIGQDAVFKVRTNMLGDRSVQTDVMANLVDLQTGLFEMKSLSSYANESIEVLESKIDANSSEAIVRMKMSERMKSGNILISFYKVSHGTVISFISENFNLFVRPSNQTGPYPPGYIFIRKYPYKKTNEDGATIEPCRANQMCPIYCEAVGEDIETVQVIQTNPDGTRVELETEPQSINFGFDSKYLKASTLFVKVNESSNPDVKYLCVATNQQGKQATHYFVILPYIPLKIIESKSSIITGNGQLNLTCTVTGLPEPTVRFEVSTSGGQWYYSYTPDTITSLGNNTYLATKSADYDRSSMGQLYSGSCTATGEEGANYESYDHYYFKIPELSN